MVREVSDEPRWQENTTPGHPLDQTLEGRKRLIIDPGVKEIIRLTDNDPVVSLDGSFQGSGDTLVDVNLGELRTDHEGRLVAIPGSGFSSCIQDGANQPEIDSIDWFDTICDGWVDVTVIHPEISSGRSVPGASCSRFPLRS